jgi:acyl carrier protein
LIGQILKDLLGINPTYLDETVSFRDIGLNSRSALRMLDQLESELRIEVPVTFMTDLPTISELSAYLTTSTQTSAATEPNR